MIGRSPTLQLLVALGLGLTGCDEARQRSGDSVELPECAEGWLADGGACVPEHCGTGSWGDLEVDGTTVYVDIEAAEGGDGSEGSPLRSIQPALDLAGSRGGGVVAVATGTYAETLALTSDHAGVQLAGRCRELVILDASVGDEDTPGIEVSAGYGEVELSGLTVQGAGLMGILLSSGQLRLRDLGSVGNAWSGLAVKQASPAVSSLLEVDGCVVEANRVIGVYAEDPGAHVELRDTIVSGTLPMETGGDGGYGIQVVGGASLNTERCEIHENHVVGVKVADAGSVVTILDGVVRDTIVSESGGGCGLEATEGGLLSVEGCLVLNNMGTGVGLYDAGTVAMLSDCSVSGSIPDSQGLRGYGLEVADGAVATLESVEVEGNTQAGIYARDAGTELWMGDSAVMDTLAGADGTQNAGVVVAGGASLLVEGGWIGRNSGAGLLVGGGGSTARLRVVSVSDSLLDHNGDYGRGVEAQSGALLQIHGCAISNNRSEGVFAVGSDTVVELCDSQVWGTRPSGRGEAGFGIEVHSGAALRAEGCVVRDNSHIGVTVLDHTSTVTLVDSVVRDTLPSQGDESGVGLQAVDGAALRCEGCEIVGSLGVGVAVSSGGSELSLQDSTVRDTRSLGSGDFGYGIQVAQGAQAKLVGCRVVGNTGCGILAQDPGSSLEIEASSVDGTEAGFGYKGNSAIGIGSQRGAVVAASGLIAEDNDGPALFVAGSDAWLGCEGCSLTDNAFAGAVTVSAGSLELRSCSISGSRESTDIGGGVGIYAAEQLGAAAPELSVRDCIVRDNPVAGVHVAGHGSYSIVGNQISGSTGVRHGPTHRCGDGVYASGTATWNGAEGLLVRDNDLVDNLGAGLLLDDAEAELLDNDWTDNEPDLVVQGESCSMYQDEYLGAPTQQVCPEWDRPTCAMAFVLSLQAAEIAARIAPVPSVASGSEVAPVFDTTATRGTAATASRDAAGRGGKRPTLLLPR